MEKLNMIVAYDENRVIGHEGDMPWKGDLPADLTHFKNITSGHTVLMGRTTHESIGQPLPERRNIVLTRQPDVTIEGCEVAHSLEEVFDISGDEEEIFVIGGEKLYRLAMPTAHKLYVTKIEAEFVGDTYFPALPPQWQEIHREEHQADERNAYNYTFVEYERYE